MSISEVTDFSMSHWSQIQWFFHDFFIFTDFKNFSWNSMIFPWSWNRSEFQWFFKSCENPDCLLLLGQYGLRNSCYWDTGTNGDFEIFYYWDTGTNVNLRDFLLQPWDKRVLQNFPQLGPMLDLMKTLYTFDIISEISTTFIDKN